MNKLQQKLVKELIITKSNGYVALTSYYPTMQRYATHIFTIQYLKTISVEVLSNLLGFLISYSIRYI